MAQVLLVEDDPAIRSALAAPDWPRWYC